MCFLNFKAKRSGSEENGKSFLLKKRRKIFFLGDFHAVQSDPIRASLDKVALAWKVASTRLST